MSDLYHFSFLQAGQAALNANKKLTVQNVERTCYKNEVKAECRKTKKAEQKLEGAEKKIERLKNEAADAKGEVENVLRQMVQMEKK